MKASSKEQFPIFKDSLKGWTYLDNAATTQKPASVIKTINEFYSNGNANIHRGLYDLSQQATQHYEEARKKVQVFIGALHPSEIAFTSGTTESINNVANSFLYELKEGDEIVVSAMEHHSNLIPWQMVCERSQAKLRVIPVNPDGDLVLENLEKLLNRKTKLITLSHISNTLGTINPLRKIIAQAHDQSIPVLIDAAQSVGHIPVHVSELNIDFLVFSAHKMFGPMGTGVLYVNRKHHDFIRPLSFGGGAIKHVSFTGTRLRDFPFCIEAGTPNVPGVLGLSTAVDFLNESDIKEIASHSRELATTLRIRLRELGFVKILGEPADYSGIVSFVVDGIHAHDVASFLSDKKIAVRAGHHCTQPLHDQLGIPASVRVSFSIYNTQEEIEQLMEALINLKKFWE